MPPSLIDPYGLLGVTVASTCQEVRRAYYDLALHAHPDKGGSPEQMRVVQAAYEYVSRQVAGVNRSRTYEDAEADFAEFLAAQGRAEYPCFMDVHADAFDLPRFNDLWAAAAAAGGGGETTDHASEPGGYGDMMAPRQPPGAEYAPVESARAPPMDLVLTLFEEPLPRVMPARLVRDLLAASGGPLEDYSTDALSDYRLAFAGGVLPPGVRVPDPRPVAPREYSADDAL